MGTLAPWAPMTGLRREMDRVFDRFFEPRWEGPRWEGMEAVAEWWPKVDLTETKDALVVKAEVPGVEQKDIALNLHNETLTIKGEKREEKEEKDERYHRMERAYGEFVRTLRLPVAVDATRVMASFKNGLLTITLPKTPAAKGTTIPVKDA